MKVLDTKTVIINLLEMDKKTYLSVKRLQKLLVFIYNELSKRDALGDYEIVFDISFDSIERTVLCNSRIFDLDFDGDLIYLRERNIDDLARQYTLDTVIKGIIDTFVQEGAA